MTNVGFVATRPYLIVIRKINIENEFFCKGTEGGGFTEGFPVSWVGSIGRSDFETRRIEAYDVFP